MIPVTPDHLPGILMYQTGKLRFLIPILPTRCRNDNKHSQFIACIHKRRVLRIMCDTDNPATGITQFFGIPPLTGVRQSISDISKILMPIGTDQLPERFSIQPKTFFPFKFRFPNTGTGNSTVQRIFALLHSRFHAIQIRRIG